MGWIVAGVVVLAVVWGRHSWHTYRRASDARGRRAALAMGAAGGVLLAVAALQLLLER